MRQAKVFADCHGLVEPAKRVSSIMRESENISQLFLPHVKAAMDEYDVAGVLGITPGLPPRHELQVSGNGSFFKVWWRPLALRYRCRI